MRYLNATELFEREGDLYFHPDDVWLSDDPEGAVVVDMNEHPDIFWNEDEKQNLLDKFYTEGHLFPRYSYDLATKVFTAVDVQKSLFARRAIRRRTINEMMEVRVRIPTELKKLRLALKAIVENQPALLALPEVADFMTMSDKIETLIGLHPKED